MKDDLGRPSRDHRPATTEFWQGMTVALVFLVIAMVVFYFLHG
jgi:hypothetical protein